MSADLRCGPYVCRYPDPIEHPARSFWQCPDCGSLYRLTRPKPWRWWRNWSAPNGHWHLIKEGEGSYRRD